MDALQTLNLVTVGDLEINTAEKTASLAGEPVKLNLGERRMLAYLGEHQGETLTKDVILDALFGTNGHLHVIDATLKSLRGKLCCADRYRYIATMPGYHRGIMLRLSPHTGE